jgi:hypothetical protein
VVLCHLMVVRDGFSGVQCCTCFTVEVTRHRLSVVILSMGVMPNYWKITELRRLITPRRKTCLLDFSAISCR